jgi:acyl dehydratase
VNFVNAVGLIEPLFMDMEYVKKESVFGTRAAPGTLTFALSEGLVIQTGLIHGVAMAWLGGEVKVVAPVLAGDTIRVEVEIADKRETKKTDRGIVTYKHRVLNQRGETVMELKLQRMIRRKPAS